MKSLSQFFNKTQKFFIGIFLSVSFLGSVLHAETTQLPVPEVETLPNGLKLAWFLSDRLPTIDLVLMIKSGYRDDPAGKTGTCQLLSEVIDRGAGGMTAQQIAQSIEKLGASRYASADDDTFSLGVHGLAPDAPMVLELLAKLAMHPDFPAEEVRREHARMMDRWTHVADYGETLASLAYRRLLADGTSYSRGNFYSLKEFSNITRDDLVQFHRKHFTPKNSILLVIGQGDRNTLKKKIIAAFEEWSGEVPQHEWKSFKDQRLPKQRNGIILIDRPNLNQAQVRIGFRAPLMKAPEHYPLIVANAMLSEYFNSRLNTLIRDQLGLTYSIESSFSYSKDLALFTISSATENKNVSQLIQKTIEVLKELKRGPIPPDELRMAKEYLVGGFPIENATLVSIAARWLGGYVFDLGPNHLNEFIPKVNQVREDEILQALKQSFNLDQITIVVAGDAQQIIRSLNRSSTGHQKKWPVYRMSLPDVM